ncbi:MAG: TauD/TfdA family dioxygenase [Pseudomonadota bacterium]
MHARLQCRVKVGSNARIAVAYDPVHTADADTGIAMQLTTSPLHLDFGVEIHGVDLKMATAGHLYPAIRDAFETHSLLLFRNQTWEDADILRFGRLFGPIENRTDRPDHVAMVSNVLPDGSVMLPDAQRVKDLRANMLWHTDSTFLPVPALANIITARVIPSEGGTTELVSTRSGLKHLSQDVKALLSQGLHHRYTHSRAKIDRDLAQAEHITKWPEQTWRGIWPNPVNGQEAVYIASHACGIVGMDDTEAQHLIDDVVDTLTRDSAVFSHAWQVGDVLIWDERATLHRGMPWPFDQARTLASICIAAGARDGLDAVRVTD